MLLVNTRLRQLLDHDTGVISSDDILKFNDALEALETIAYSLNNSVIKTILNL
jgi:hypothetical protein